MNRPKIRYWVSYTRRPYGIESKMIKRESIPATSKPDAEKWKKAILKGGHGWNVQIEKEER